MAIHLSLSILRKIIDPEKPLKDDFGEERNLIKHSFHICHPFNHSLCLTTEFIVNTGATRSYLSHSIAQTLDLKLARALKQLSLVLWDS